MPHRVLTRTRRRVALALSVLTVSALLAACGGGNQGPPTLVWYINPDVGNTDASKGGQATLAKECTESSGGAYDIVVCMEMLEHVPEPDSVLRALHSLVKPGGHVFLSTLNRNLKSYLLAIVGAEYVMNLLTRGTHTYERFIKPSELARWARAAELSVEDIAGLAYDPFENSARQSTNVDVNYMMHLRRAEERQ